MIFLRLFKHLLPTGRAWRLTIGKTLRDFFKGLSGTGQDVKDFTDEVWTDIDPQKTRELDQWDDQFALRNSGISEQERRSRLDAAWKSIGGQDPEYIQSTLRANGFDVFIHEWWEPGTEAEVGVKLCVTPRNPLTVIRGEFTSVVVSVDCGELLAECGEAFAECGNSLDPRGYPLVNKIFSSEADLISLSGEASTECGESEATCGNYVDFKEVPKNYQVPIDPTKWPYFLYIGGEVFGDMAQVDPKRKDEFEDLCLKICPSQQWLGILVEYV